MDKKILWRKWGWIGHTLRKLASSPDLESAGEEEEQSSPEQRVMARGRIWPMLHLE